MPVLSLITSIFTPGNTAPLLSVAVPETVPVVTCPGLECASSSNAESASIGKLNFWNLHTTAFNILISLIKSFRTTDL
jgi:hypothetical protein